MTSEEQRELQERTLHIDKIRQELPDFDTTKLEWARRLDDTDIAVLDDPATNYAQAGVPDLPAGAKVLTLQQTKDEFVAEFQAKAASLSPHQGAGRNTEEARKSFLKSYLAQIDAQYPANKGVIVRAQPSIDFPGKALDTNSSSTAKDSGPTYFWFANREAPSAEIKGLAQLKGFLHKGQFLTKFRKVFLKHEMKDDLDLVPLDRSRETTYIRILPQSPP